MERRDFLRLGIAGMMTGACARPSVYPPSMAVSREEMDAFLARLDGGMDRIRDGNALASILDHVAIDRGVIQASRLRTAEDLCRKALRSMLLVGARHDLPPSEQNHPELVERIQRGLGEMDEATLGMTAYLEQLKDEERTEIQARLRARPELVDGIGEALDVQCAKIGVSLPRRVQLRSIVSQASWQIRAQPLATFIEDHRARVRRIAERQYRRVVQEVRVLDMSTAPAPESSRGTVIGVGAILMGVGTVMGLAGLAGGLNGLFVATAGGVLLVGGLITLIVGLAMN